MNHSRNPFDDLPFVRPREMPDGRGYDFWCPEPAEVVSARNLGKRYCFQYIKVEAESMSAGRGVILGFIVRDMIAKKDTGEVARGFIYTIAEALAQAGLDSDFVDWVNSSNGA